MKLWSDPDIESLSAGSRYVFVYLITNEHRNDSGLYPITFSKIAFETGLTPAQVNEAMQSLEKSGRIIYDRETSTVWVINALRHTPVNPNIQTSVVHDLGFSSSPKLVESFVSKYPIYKKLVKDYLRVRKGFGKGDSRYKDKVKDSISKDKIKDTPEEFENLWKSYPNRQGKKNALRHFLVSVKNPEDLMKMKAALANYLKSGNVLNGYIQQGGRWFGEWQDWVEPTDAMMKGNSNGTGKRGYRFDASKYPTLQGQKSKP